MRRVLFVDVDGVVANTQLWWLTLYNREYGTNVQYHEITEWDWTSKFEYPISQFYHNYIGAKPVAGALESIWQLAGVYRIVFATAGMGYDWLKSYYPPLRAQNFVQIQDKSLLNGWGLIDDNPSNLDVFQGQKFLLSQPWNTGRGLNDCSWEQITQHLLEAI